MNESEYGRELLLETRRIMRELGVPEHLTGHRYLVEAVLLCIRQPEYLRRITARLYPEVARRCHGSARQVERAMRHAIETAWLRCDLKTMERYFGNTVDPRRCKPVNSHFIARVASAVQLGE